MEKDEYFKSINMICAAQRNTKGIFGWNDFGDDGKMGVENKRENG